MDIAENWIGGTYKQAEEHYKRSFIQSFGLKKRPNNSMSKLSLFDTKQEVHGLQVFTFSVLTINDEHTKPRFKRKRRG